MHRFISALMTIGLFFSLISAAPSETQHFPLEIFDILDDHRLVIFVRSEDIAASPSWLPGEGAVPFTISGVIAKMQQEIERDARLRGAEIHEIELKPIHGYAEEHRWYYLVQLRTHQGRKSKAYYYAVLLSGKLVPAIEKPTSIK